MLANSTMTVEKLLCVFDSSQVAWSQKHERRTATTQKQDTPGDPALRPPPPKRKLALRISSLTCFIPTLSSSIRVLMAVTCVGRVVNGASHQRQSHFSFVLFVKGQFRDWRQREVSKCQSINQKDSTLLPPSLTHSY